MHDYRLRNFYFSMVYILTLNLVCAWDVDELEIFDLVDDINKNFYDFMGITQNASNNEVKRAFRSLSIQVHPDKNPSEDANVQFRNLVSIYEVLKDTSKREIYNRVLRDGMPNWKSALYYYRRMRKIGLYEGACIVFLIISVGQYLFAWAAYLEKKYTAEQVLSSKLKKLKKKHRNVDMQAILNEIPSPSLKNTLPLQIPLFIWNLPLTIKNGLNKANQFKEMALEKRRQELAEANRQENFEREYEKQILLRKEKKENLRKRKQNLKMPQKTEEELAGYSQIQEREIIEDETMRPVAQKAPLSGSFWTDEALAELVRLVKKYPAGLSSRWITIAENMNRTVQEVTFMATKIKENDFRILGQTEIVAENIYEAKEIVRKEKNMVISDTNWTQHQQKALEYAIVMYRKTAGCERWEKIANYVPNKSKEECFIRYKYLCELVKSQKKTADEINREVTSAANSLVDTEELTTSQWPKESRPVTAEDLADEISENGGKKLYKRKKKRRQGDLLTVDSNDVYI